MAWIRSLTLVALLTLVASSVKAAPPSFDNHGDHGYHPFVLVEAANYENLALPMPELRQRFHNFEKPQFQEVDVESRKFFRPHYFLYPYILSHPNHPLNNPYPELAETVETEELADDETPIAEVECEDAQTDNNEGMPETIEIPKAYENKPDVKIDEEEVVEEVEIADKKQEDVSAVDNDEGNVKFIGLDY